MSLSRLFRLAEVGAGSITPQFSGEPGRFNDLVLKTVRDLSISLRRLGDSLGTSVLLYRRQTWPPSGSHSAYLTGQPVPSS